VNSKTAFAKDSAFTRELKQEVRALLARDPDGRFADRKTWWKAGFLLALNLSLYLGILLPGIGNGNRILLTLFFACSTLFLGLNVMHEAAHGNFSSDERVNRGLAFTFDLFGISSDLYLVKHIQFHHNYTNLFELDGDINEAPLIRMSEEQELWGLHRFQAYYTPFLYSLITVTWPVFDLLRLIDPKVGKKAFQRPSIRVISRILLLKAVHYTLALALPTLLIGFRETLLLFSLFHAVLGTVLALIFQVAHVHESAMCESGSRSTDWHLHQIRTSADFAVDQPWVNATFGGLNFQMIHHLFPNVSHRHFPVIRKIVIRLSREHGVRVHGFRTFGSAIWAHFRLLHRLGRSPGPA
jgi:linoleoyl-CoA desaturase